MSTTDAPNPVTVTIPFVPVDGGPAFDLTILAEPVAAGLAITPMTGVDATGKVFYLGGFQLTHIPSGKRLGTDQVVSCLGCVTWFAEALVATGIDWSQDGDRLNAHLKANPEHVAAINEASLQLLACEESECDTSRAIAEERDQKTEGTDR